MYTQREMKMNYVGVFFYILVGEVPFKSNYDLNIFVENSSGGSVSKQQRFSNQVIEYLLQRKHI